MPDLSLETQGFFPHRGRQWRAWEDEFLKTFAAEFGLAVSADTLRRPPQDVALRISWLNIRLPEGKASLAKASPAPKLAPNVVLAAIPNGGARDAVTGARLKREGVVRGMPDLLLACPRCGRHALCVEMKTARGRVSESQRGLFPLLEAQGYGVAVCRGWHEAAETVEAYLAGRWEPSHE